MKRIGIFYGGRLFSIGEEDYVRMKAEIEEAHRGGGAKWITVNYGEGRPQPAELLVGPGIAIGLMPVPDEPVVPDEPAESPMDSVPEGGEEP